MDTCSGETGRSPDCGQYQRAIHARTTMQATAVPGPEVRTHPAPRSPECGAEIRPCVDLSGES
eukprot:773060-Prymnesium_polylepis.1